MKISKLFHWLYAVLMFLPLVMFLPSCLYYSLNKYATNETTTVVTYKYQSNEVNSINDLVVGNIYNFHTEDATIEEICNSNGYIAFELLSDLYLDVGNSVILQGEYIPTTLTKSNYIGFYYDGNNENISLFNDYNYLDYGYMEIRFIDGSFLNDITIKLLRKSNNIQASYFSYTDYNVIESVDTNVQDTISNKMYQAWESIWNLPLFVWTKNSFISAPFTYITGLFGLAFTNSLNYLFTYFCSISICWLVFDVLMYVPNLAHRWLDKGAVE